MPKRPISVAILGCLLIVTGIGGFASHIATFRGLELDLLAVALLCAAAVVAGAFVIAGHNWARWLAIAWMAFHVVVSLPDSLKLVVHAVLLAVFAYVLFRPPANRFFRRQ